MMLYHHAKCGYRRYSSWGDIIQINIHWNPEHFCDLDLDHNKAIQSFHKTIRLMMMCHQTKISCKRNSNSENIPKSHNLTKLFLTVTLILKTADQSFLKTIWLIMMHHHTKFGSKRLCNSENTIWTFTDVLEFCCDLDLEHNNPVTKYNTLACDNVLSNQVWQQKDQQFKRYSSLHDTLTHNDASHYQIWKQNLWWFRRYHPDKH